MQLSKISTHTSRFGSGVSVIEIDAYLNGSEDKFA